MQRSFLVTLSIPVLVLTNPLHALGAPALGLGDGHYRAEQRDSHPSPTANGGSPVAGDCTCNCNVDGSGICNFLDMNTIVHCIQGDCSGCVNSCDVDCDGDVDCCDANAFLCYEDPECCKALGTDPATCGGACETAVGACCTGGEPFCLQVIVQTCVDMGGFYQGAFTTCDDTDGNGLPDKCEQAVPAVSDWGLVVLILLILTAGSMVFARWRRTG